MADGEKRGLSLSWQALLFAIPALAVYLLNDQLLAAFGKSPGAALLIPDEYGVHMEPGARLEFLAAFLLFVAVATAMIAVFVSTLWSLDFTSRTRFALGAGALTLIGVVVLWLCPTPGIAADIGLPSNCPRSIVRGTLVAGAEGVACSVRAYTDLLNLMVVWKWVLVTATAAVIFGTVCCLAGAPEQAPRPAKVAALKRQARRLHIFLYLAAMLMVSTLLVQHAFVRWPRFAVTQTGPFDAHVNAIILYYGVGYSIFLASFYLPVVWRLGWRAERVKDEKLRDEILETATSGPAGVAKSAAAILAPALAGLLSAWIDLSG